MSLISHRFQEGGTAVKVGLQAALGLHAFFFSFRKEITLAFATARRFYNHLVCNFLNFKKIGEFYLSSGIILQMKMVLGIISLFDCGCTTDS